jgi:hypothetical protein
MSLINWREHTKNGGEDLCAWLLLELIANNDGLDRMLKSGEIGVEKIDVSLTIEGVQVDFEWATEQMEKDLDRLIVNEAKKLIINKLNEFLSKLHTIEDNLDQLFDSVNEEVDKLYEEKRGK